VAVVAMMRTVNHLICQSIHVEIGGNLAENPVRLDIEIAGFSFAMLKMNLH